MSRYRQIELRMFLAKKRLLQRLYGSPSQKETLFVAGNQRSGTNMLMDVLERSMTTEVFHEKDDRAYRNYLMRELPVLRELHQESRASMVVYKALCELDRIRELLTAFEPARVVWIVRDYRDGVNSMLRSFGDSFIPQLRRIVNERSPRDWRARGMSDETHEFARAVLADGPNAATAAAFQWYSRNVLFFEQALSGDPRACVVRYERLVTEPHAEFTRICEFAGIPLAERMLAGISPASIGKNPAPDIAADVAGACTALLDSFAELTR